MVTIINPAVVSDTPRVIAFRPVEPPCGIDEESGSASLRTTSH